MKIELSSAELTLIVKEAMLRYQGKPFGGCVLNQKPGGVEVQFYDAGAETQESKPAEERRHDEPDPYAPANQILTTWGIVAGMGGGSTNGFGFGGGSSGGGGASGGW